MSKNTMIKTIRREIDDLNWKIDMKIIKGMSYRQDARRHKILLMQLRRLTSTESIFGRVGMTSIFGF